MLLGLRLGRGLVPAPSSRSASRTRRVRWGSRPPAPPRPGGATPRLAAGSSRPCSHLARVARAGGWCPAARRAAWPEEVGERTPLSFSLKTSFSPPTVSLIMPVTFSEREPLSSEGGDQPVEVASRAGAVGDTDHDGHIEYDEFAKLCHALEAEDIGGQAVIEGVMMRSPGGLSVAVRRPDDSIAIHEEPYRSRFSKKLWKLPGFRGVATLVESLSIGFRALNFSAEQQMTEEEKEELPKKI